MKNPLKRLVGNHRRRKALRRSEQSVYRRFYYTRRNKDTFFASKDWARLRAWVYSTYRAVCFCCGSKSKLHVDHIRPMSINPKRCLDARNLQILCSVCNEAKSNKGDHRFPSQIHLKSTYLIPQDVAELRPKWCEYFPLREPIVTKRKWPIKPTYAYKEKIKKLRVRPVIKKPSAVVVKRISRDGNIAETLVESTKVKKALFDNK